MEKFDLGRNIGSKLPVTDCGEATHFLGVDIEKRESGFFYVNQNEFKNY